jgi:hypothetical protein
MSNLQKSLLTWLLYGAPPDLWAIDCLNTSIVNCIPIPLKYSNVLGGPWRASSLETIGELIIRVQLVTLDLIPFENYILFFCLFKIGGPDENDGHDLNNIKETESEAEEQNGKYFFFNIWLMLQYVAFISSRDMIKTTSILNMNNVYI